MARFYYLLALASLQISTSVAIPNCPIFGAEFPPPQRLSEHSRWKQALTNLTAAFDFLDANVTGDDLSYSVQIFSTDHGNKILAERHRTATTLLPETEGVKEVGADTVYRIGSVSKVFTVLAFLAEVGDTHWNTPITRFIPELAQYSARTLTQSTDDVRRTDWDDITIGALAAQVSGVGRDCKCSKARRIDALEDLTTVRWSPRRVDADRKHLCRLEVELSDFTRRFSTALWGLATLHKKS